MVLALAPAPLARRPALVAHSRPGRTKPRLGRLALLAAPSGSAAPSERGLASRALRVARALLAAAGGLLVARRRRSEASLDRAWHAALELRPARQLQRGSSLPRQACRAPTRARAEQAVERSPLPDPVLGPGAGATAAAARDPDVIFLGKSAPSRGARAPSEEGISAATAVLRRMVERPYLRAGSTYRSDQQWGDTGAAVSTALSVFEGDRFELEVRSLDSKAGGSEGWIRFQGGMTFEPVHGRPGVKRALLRCTDPAQAIEYDEAVLNRGTSFVFGCLKRMARATFDALVLEVDIADDTVRLKPQASILRFFWDQPVDLQRTTERSPEAQRQRQPQLERSPERRNPLAAFIPKDWPQLRVGVGVLTATASGGGAPRELAAVLS
ncbi:unnamed protein product [Prorocentrum cordatum]|uniref:NADH:ubiquinone oxidoreductase intermediate-associated protein 30 domain-containing protein n=1 Tax=Prorocentrum cordatum TaxID=2364126 RepID=A0ABN9W4C6_9DINO|nr:unnamed protein product [Polarella glacialis]